jgi:broad specificity phosphatase PhoE
VGIGGTRSLDVVAVSDDGFEHAAPVRERLVPERARADTRMASASGWCHETAAITRRVSPRSPVRSVSVLPRSVVLNGQVCAFDAQLISHI